MKFKRLPSHRRLNMADFLTPPNPVRHGSKPPPPDNLGALIKLYQMGILTEEETRQKALAWRTPQTTIVAPSPPIPPRLPTRNDCAVIVPSKRKLAPSLQSENCNHNVPSEKKRFNKKKDNKAKKCRPGRPVLAVATLRKICKDPTRQRFFDQCRDPASVL